MIRGNRILAGFFLATLAVGALSGAAAIADEGAQKNEAHEDAVLQPVEDESEEGETSSSAQPDPEGQGTVEIDPESAAGACPGGTALKIDNLRSNGTFGPITISDFTNTSFTWTSTEAVSAVLVKDGGGHKTNPGGSSGSASTFGQDISHVIFCLGGDVPEVDAETPEEKAPCEGDETMPEDEACASEPCEGDETMPDSESCAPAPDVDTETPEDKAPCDGDEKMPGRQDCNEIEDVAAVKSDPEKPAEDDDVQGAGLVADGEPDAAAQAAQPMAAQPLVQGATLPFTGGQVAPLLMVALGFVTAGGGAILIKRP